MWQSHFDHNSFAAASEIVEGSVKGYRQGRKITFMSNSMVDLNQAAFVFLNPPASDDTAP